MPEILETYPFDDEFEKVLLAFLVMDKEFYLKARPFVKRDYFESQLRRDIYQRASAYVEKYGEAPSQEALRNEITAMFHEQKKKDINIDDYWELIDDLFKRDLTGGPYALEQVTAFARSREMKIALKDGGDRVIGNKDLNPILDNVTKALAIGNKKILPKLRTCNDVDENEPDDDWIAKGLIAKDAINVWYGPPGIAKSHLFWFLGNCINDGKEALGIEVIKRTSTLHLDLENSPSVRKHCKRICGGGGMTLITLQDEIEIPDIDSDEFEAFVLSFPVGVIGIDTVAMLLTTQKRIAEGKWEVTPMTRVLKRLCAKGYTFVLIFHSLKGDPKTIKGPQELLGQADHVVAVYEVKSVGGEEVEQLEVDPNKPKTLFVGTRSDLKSRFEKSIYYLRYDPRVESHEKGFSRLASPDDPKLEAMHALLFDYVEGLKTQYGPEPAPEHYPSKSKFTDLVMGKLGISYHKARTLIDNGVGSYWGMDTLDTGKAGKSPSYYFPKKVKKHG